MNQQANPKTGEGKASTTKKTFSRETSVSTTIYADPSIVWALLTHPAVHDVGVIGVPDPDWGESVAAVVQLVPGRTFDDDLEAELAAHCRSRLASHKVPRRWVEADDLPRTDAGKLAKRKLRDDLLAAGRL